MTSKKQVKKRLMDLIEKEKEIQEQIKDTVQQYCLETKGGRISGRYEGYKAVMRQDFDLVY